MSNQTAKSVTIHGKNPQVCADKTANEYTAQQANLAICFSLLIYAAVTGCLNIIDGTLMMQCPIVPH